MTIAQDILPYYFAVECSPTDARTAFAVATLGADGGEVGVSVILEDRNESTELFKFSRLGPVKMAWSTCGRLLAFAQDSNLMVRETSGALRLLSLPDNVQWLGFDDYGQLWCLSGGRLEVRTGDAVTAAIDLVAAAAVGRSAAYCRREREGLRLYLHDENRVHSLCSLPVSSEQGTVRLSLNGSYLAAGIASQPVNSRARVRIVRFDLTTFEAIQLIDEDLMFGFNGGPGIQVVMLSSGEILAAYEGGSCCRVWTLRTDAPAEAISPAGFEVFDLVVNASGTRLAIVASETTSAAGSCERQLLIAGKEGDRWRFSSTLRGVHDLPRWRHDGQLEVLFGGNGRWARHVHRPDAVRCAASTEKSQAIRVSRDGIEYDLLRLPGQPRNRAGIILLPRLHQQFTAGAQSFFFHHLLFTIARGLASDGYNVVVLSGPGAIGRGRSRREPSGPGGSYFAQLHAVIDDVAQSLRAEGCHRVGILGGSLAAVPALRVIGPGTRVSACALLSPLFEASIPVTMPYRHHLLDDPLIEPLKLAAAKVQVPVLVIHDARDEVVPPGQISEFSKSAPDSALIELRALADEGHIPKHVQSWQEIQSAIETFFRSHLVDLPAFVPGSREP